ncbi:MAG: TolC family protein [candidate division KSB1 bacterium]|nr:TolC family protein [candidate division KSB1 bacterium]
MKSIKLLIILFLLISAVHSQESQKQLHEYLKIAAENNPGLRAQFSRYMAELQKAPQAGALPDPAVAFGWFIQPVETRMGPQQLKISASQMFPWFGTLRARENAAVRQAQAEYHTFLNAKSRLFHEVRSTWYDLYVNRRAAEITRENLELLHSFQKLAQAKISAGTVSAVDEYRIEMEIGDLQNQLTLLQDQGVTLKTAFNNLLNKDASTVKTPDTLQTTDLAMSKSEIADSIRINNHRLQRLREQQSARASRITAAQKAGAPSFTLGLDYTFIGEGEDNLPGTDAFVFPKLGIRLPLYRNKYRAMVDEATYQQTAAVEEEADAENDLESMLERAWTDYQDADRRIDLYTRQLQLARQALNLLETEYSTGSSGFEEVLRMERKSLKYGLELERARADKQTAISFITFLTGR